MKGRRPEDVIGEWGIRDVTPLSQKERSALDGEADLNPQLETLAAAYDAHRHDGDAWRRAAERWDFGSVNELIEKHNRWFPAEARLGMDPRTRDFVKVGGKPYRRGLLDATRILDRFPVAL